jgi:hypothetical protein
MSFKDILFVMKKLKDIMFNDVKHVLIQICVDQNEVIVEREMNIAVMDVSRDPAMIVVPSLQMRILLVHSIPLMIK